MPAYDQSQAVPSSSLTEIRAHGFQGGLGHDLGKNASSGSDNHGTRGLGTKLGGLEVGSLTASIFKIHGNFSDDKR